jgi:cytochrome c peroxidase
MYRAKLLLTLSCLLMVGFATAAAALTEKEQLGSLLYFDKYLSLQHDQSCASCHFPDAGYDDPENNLPVSEGSVDGLYGGRNSPAVAYAAASPPFQYVDEVGYVGGQFWDGRANGLKGQAKGPFLNPVEMAMEDSVAVLQAIAETNNANYEQYKKLFKKVYGINIDSFNNFNRPRDAKMAYDDVADAIATYERSSEVNTFSSRYDSYLAGAPLEDVLIDPAEREGKVLFDANCRQCHPSEGDVTAHQTAMPTVLSSFSYHNLGLPHNEHRLMNSNAADYGLGGRDDIDDPAEYGKFKTPTLRNIAMTAPYGHNGYFTHLKKMVQFLNDRDAFDPAEVSDNVTEVVGDLGLSDEEIDQIVAFLNTLTDERYLFQ